jgi:hypothetical protein
MSAKLTQQANKCFFQPGQKTGWRNIAGAFADQTRRATEPATEISGKHSKHKEGDYA